MFLAVYSARRIRGAVRCTRCAPCLHRLWGCSLCIFNNGTRLCTRSIHCYAGLGRRYQSSTVVGRHGCLGCRRHRGRRCGPCTAGTLNALSECVVSISIPTIRSAGLVQSTAVITYAGQNNNVHTLVSDPPVFASPTNHSPV